MRRRIFNANRGLMFCLAWIVETNTVQRVADVDHAATLAQRTVFGPRIAAAEDAMQMHGDHATLPDATAVTGRAVPQPPSWKPFTNMRGMAKMGRFRPWGTLPQ